MTDVNQKTDIIKAIKECVEEIGPYKFYDEVIQEYFGGHVDLSKIPDIQ